MGLIFGNHAREHMPHLARLATIFAGRIFLGNFLDFIHNGLTTDGWITEVANDPPHHGVPKIHFQRLPEGGEIIMSMDSGRQLFCLLIQLLGFGKQSLAPTSPRQYKHFRPLFRYLAEMRKWIGFCWPMLQGHNFSLGRITQVHPVEVIAKGCPLGQIGVRHGAVGKVRNKQL